MLGIKDAGEGVTSVQKHVRVKFLDTGKQIMFAFGWKMEHHKSKVYTDRAFRFSIKI